MTINIKARDFITAFNTAISQKATALGLPELQIVRTIDETTQSPSLTIGTIVKTTKSFVLGTDTDMEVEIQLLLEDAGKEWDEFENFEDLIWQALHQETKNLQTIFNAQSDKFSNIKFNACYVSQSSGDYNLEKEFLGTTITIIVKYTAGT